MDGVEEPLASAYRREVIVTPFTTAFDVQAPVVCAPMGGVAGPALVRAVTAAGGLGLLGVETDGSATPAILHTQATRPGSTGVSRSASSHGWPKRAPNSSMPSSTFVRSR